MFTHSSNQFQEIIDFMLTEAKRRGASDVVAEVSEGQGLSVTVRKGEVETIEQSLDKQVGVTVYLGHRRGNASTSDFSKASLKATVDAASLKAAGVIRRTKDGVRVLSGGELKAKLTIEVAGASKVAVEKIEKAGGSIKLLEAAKEAAE
mgnify:CR=1 FL=1